MATDNSRLPLNRNIIETRPARVKEWLDSLPYLNFDISAQLLCEATHATNELKLKPELRMELVDLYSKPYQYYIDSQIKAGVQQTQQSIETARKQINLLKNIATNLARACRLAADQTLERKTLWGQIKPPLTNLLLSLNYLSHVLIFCYLEYSPNPKNIWKDINFIYHFAESLSQENSELNISEAHIQSGSSSISKSYKRILMASLADPHHLPYGAIWEIFEQLANWGDLVQITEFEITEDPTCRFVIDLDGDESPSPLAKYNVRKGGKSHRLINARDLISEINKQVDFISAGGRPDRSISLSPFYLKTILKHLLDVWELPAMREDQRQTGDGVLSFACGINPAYYFINGQNEFYFHEADGTPDQGEKSSSNYQLEEWLLSNESSKGFAVVNSDKPETNIKVGELIAINSHGPGQNWSVGVIRWLMIDKVKDHKLGIEIISKKIEAAAIRAVSGSVEDTQFRRALLLENEGDKFFSVVSSKGIFIPDRQLEILKGGTRLAARVEKLIESTGGFEHYRVATS